MITNKGREKLSIIHLGELNPQYKSGLNKFRSYEWLYQKYWIEELSLSKIAEMIGISIRCLVKWMNKVGVKRRKACPRSGEFHPRFKGFSINSQGYKCIYSPNHPHHDNRNYVREHILVAEKILGRYLTKQERIHHIGIKYPIDSIQNKSDNRPENLYLFSKKEHDRYHQLERMKDKSGSSKLFKPITQSNLSKNS